MKIKFWGVRGSLPASISLEQNKEHIVNILSRFIKSGFSKVTDIQTFFESNEVTDICGFGQNTTCVQVSDGLDHLVIDGGSGLKVYGDSILKNHPNNQIHHILITHFHYDHIMGLPFFSQHFIQGQEIHYYAVQPEAEKMIRSLFNKPLFPLNYENLAAKIYFHQIQPYEKQRINNFDVSAFKLDHPDPCYGFRIEKNGNVYAHAVDHEARRITEDQLGIDAGLFKGADFLYIDAQYSESEMNRKKGWGHGTFDRAFEICSIFNIQQVLLAHHDPSFSVSQIQNLVDQARVSFEKNKVSKKIEKLKWNFAYDGQEISLDN